MPPIRRSTLLLLLATLAAGCAVSGDATHPPPAGEALGVTSDALSVTPGATTPPATGATTSFGDTGSLTAVMTSFDPKVSGFAFSNGFTDLVDMPAGVDFTAAGLCGGMTYAAFDYYSAGIPAPAQWFQPAEGTPLQQYIYGRQETSLMSNLDRWAEIGFNPGGIRNAEFFNWGLDGSPGGQLQVLRSYLDRGVPVPLGLQHAGSSGNHQMLAIGYDMGRYRGNLGWYEEDLKIYVLDPNHPKQRRTLVPDVPNQVYVELEDGSNHMWRTYFVDANYHAQAPLHVVDPVYPPDGMIHEIVVTASTQGDDLRGGNDDIDVHVNLRDGSSLYFPNINGGQKWVDNSTQSVGLVLPRPVPQQSIASITMTDTFGGGVFGDNWSMGSVWVDAMGDGSPWRIANGGSYYFTGDSAPFTVALAPLPAPRQPFVTRISPDIGSTLGGTVVEIDGANFDVFGGTSVLFGTTPALGVNCPLTTQCFATSPAGTGSTYIDLSTAGGPGYPRGRFTYSPSVLGVSPRYGTVNDQVTITGVGFNPAPGAMQIRFGQSLVTVSSCGTSSCTVTVPPGAGAVDVRVTINGYTTAATAADSFTYTPATITGFSPIYGSMTGGTWMKITGVGFDPYSTNIQVFFDGVPAPYVNCSGSTSCAVITPPHATGLALVTGKVFGQDMAPSPDHYDAFTYVDHPTLTTFYAQPTGRGASALVSLDALAPAGGAVIALTSSDPSVVAVPPTYVIPAGLGSGTFQPAYLPTTSSGTVTITAQDGRAILVSPDAG